VCWPTASSSGRHHPRPRRRREPSPGQEFGIDRLAVGETLGGHDDQPTGSDGGFGRVEHRQKRRRRAPLESTTDHHGAERVRLHRRQFGRRIADPQVETLVDPGQHRIGVGIHAERRQSRGLEGAHTRTVAALADHHRSAGGIDPPGQQSTDRRSGHRWISDQRVDSRVEGGCRLDLAEPLVHAAQEAGVHVVQGVELIAHVAQIPVGALADRPLHLPDPGTLADRRVDVDQRQAVDPVE